MVINCAMLKNIPHKRIAVPLSVALLVLIYLGLTPLLGKKMEVIQPVFGKAVSAVYATGTVEATVMIPISPRVSARLIALNVDEGSRVEKGQILAQLENDELIHNVNELKAREEQTRTQYERISKLVKRKAIPFENLDKSKADYLAAKSSRESAEARAEYMKLSSPADGYVIRRDGEIGQLIAANQPLFWISCCAPLRISAEVDEEDITSVQPGQKVMISSDAFKDKVFEGAVQSITPKGDPVARSYRVRIGFKDETPMLIGMTAETNIITGETENALLIPTTALNQNNVWLVEGSHIKKQAVKIGARGVEKTEITDGLKKEDIIILNAEKDLTEGMKIRKILLSAEQAFYKYKDKQK
jgi:membrane fusion protein, multidrug efflux system